MNQNLTKRIAAIGLAAMMSGCMLGNPENLNIITESFSMTASAATASGTCGTNLNWSLSGDTLTITGTGTTIPNYGTSSSLAPWKAYASQIKKVILPKTLKVIGNAAFYKMSALEYIYTANGNGFNSPCFPDLNRIGSYAFSECYQFRGNTQNGALTFGTGAVSADGTLTIKAQAFRNCDQVRFINANYHHLIVEEKGFYHLNRLQGLNLSDTTVKLGKNAFLDCAALANANYKPSTAPIHNTAFDGTSYQTTQCTDIDYPRRNSGAATKLKGKQLVVNFFVDRAIVDLKNTYGNSRIKTLKRNEHFNPEQEYPNENIVVCPFYQYYSQLDTTGVYRRNDMTSYYAYGWNPQKCSRNDNSVITLNKLDYAAQPDPTRIPVDTAQNGTTNGFFGSYVTSPDITARLNDVRTAMDDLQAQATAYGDGFTYEMHPETNFQITYDYFDWSTYRAYEHGPNGADRGFDYTTAYGGDNPQILTAVGTFESGSTHITNFGDEPLFIDILSASQMLTGEKAQTIDLTRTGSGISNYTQFLKNKYNVSSVIYLVHFNTDSQAETWFGGDLDEFAIICDMQGHQITETIEHETAHLFGAYDYYSSTHVLSAVTNFANQYLYDDLMMCLNKRVSPVTAFSLGWLDKLNTTTYQTFFG